MNEELVVEKLLLKFRFTEPVQVQYRDYIASSKRKNLSRILKENKNYGVAIWGILIIYMLLRKLGITVSFLQAAVISGVTAAAIAVTASAGTVKLVSMATEKYSRTEEILVVEEKPAEVLPGLTFGKSAAVIKFTGTGDTGNMSSTATSVFLNTLKKEIGEANISYGNTAADKKYIITGSVEKLPDGFMLTSRIIEKSSRVIIHMDIKEISSEEQLYEESQKMAGKIAEKIK